MLHCCTQWQWNAGRILIGNSKTFPETCFVLNKIMIFVYLCNILNILQDFAKTTLRIVI